MNRAWAEEELIFCRSVRLSTMPLPITTRRNYKRGWLSCQEALLCSRYIIHLIFDVSTFNKVEGLCSVFVILNRDLKFVSVITDRRS